MRVLRTKRKCQFCNSNNLMEWDNGLGLVLLGCGNKCIGSITIYQYGTRKDEFAINEYFKNKIDEELKGGYNG